MFMRRKEPPGSPSHHVALESAVGFLHHILSIHRTPQHAVGDGKEVGTIGFKGFHSVSSCSSWSQLIRTDVVPGSLLLFHLCYFLSNTNTGWVSTARSNSSREESAVTP